MGLLQGLGLALEMRRPFMLWGNPQLGKTEMVRQLGRAYGRDVFVIIASLHEPTDFTGLPALVESSPEMQKALGIGKMMQFFPMHVLVQAALSKYGILFLDEASNTNMDIQKALMQGVHERRFGYLDMPRSVSIGLAGNPPESSAGGGELTPALASRVIHFDVEPNLQMWIKGRRDGWADPDVYRLGPGWRKGMPQAIEFINGFLDKAGVALLHAMPKAGSKELSRGWPGYRTWEMVTEIECAAAFSGADVETRSLMIAGAIGAGAASELETYRRDIGLPKPEEVLANPRLAQDPREDRLQRIVESALGLAKSRMDGAGTDDVAAQAAWDDAWGVLGHVATDRPDVAVSHARSLMSHPSVLIGGVPRFSIPSGRVGSLYNVLMGEL